MNVSDLQNVTNWLIDGARSAASPPAMMGQACERLVEAGLPLWRVGVFVRTLHPDIFGVSFVWRLGGEVVVTQADFDIRDTDQYRSSPLSVLYSTEQEVRRKLSATGDNSPFLADMREEGVTDYIAIPVRFTDGSIHASSWTTKRPGGFSDDHIEGLRRLVLPLTRVIEIINLRRTALNLLDTYVGNRAGARIWGGQIRRGHHDTMHAAIWLSDLRGFTALSDRLPAETVVEILNRYFDCQVAAIRKHGGEVLKFMGDGLLAVFPIAEADGGDTQQVCSRVLEAARESRASVLDMQFSIGDVVERFRFGVALHVGKILFGNIGGGNRLDFTCIGPAVNLAARLEKIAGRLNRTIVASAEFAGICAGSWADLGEFPITGFAKAERVYGLADETPAD
jgi:adenylate cyclase